MIPDGYFVTLKPDQSLSDSDKEDWFFENFEAKDIFFKGSHAVSIISGGNSTASVSVSEVKNYNGEFNPGVTLESVIDRLNWEDNWFTGSIRRLNKIWQISVSTNLPNGPGNDPDLIKIGTIGVAHEGPSPQQVSGLLWEVDNFTVTEMMDNTFHNDSKVLFTHWTEKGDKGFYDDKKSDNSFSSSVVHYDTNFTLKANYDYHHPVTVVNALTVPGNTGTALANSDTLHMPADPVFIKEDQPIALEAMNWHTIDHIQYRFQYWTFNINSDTSYNRQFSFTPTGPVTATAHFIGVPEVVPNLRKAYTAPFSPIKLLWDQHPNPNCKYQVWRYRKNLQAENGEDEEYWENMAFLDHNVTTWTDPDYRISRGLIHWLLKYDVRAYYVPDNSPADTYFRVSFFGSLAFSIDSTKTKTEKIGEDESKEELSVFPNPFNPSTTIRLQLKEESSLQISIYDIRGQLVSKITDMNANAGENRFTWNGRDAYGSTVASGVYFLRVQIGTRHLVRKLLLMK